jgi:hypothetical protein
MSKLTNEDNIENTQMPEYIDSEELEFDKDKKALIDKVMKSSAELENIQIVAKDLNFNIEVKIIFNIRD